MKKWKKATAAVLLTVMAAGCVAGCGASKGTDNTEKSESSGKGGKYETVKIAIPVFGDVTDVDKVEAAINKITEEKYNADISLDMIASGNWSDQSNLLLTGDEVDIIACFSTPLTTYVNNGQFLNLDSYVDKASEDFKKVWSDEDLQGTTIQGSVYAIPNLRNFGNYRGLAVDEEIAKEYGFEDGQKITMDDIDEFFQWCKEKYPDKYELTAQDGQSMINGWTWDGLGDSKYLGVLSDCGQDTTVQNLFETDEVISMLKPDFLERGWSVRH